MLTCDCDLRVEHCRHCGAAAPVADCSCGRPFVVTTAHVEGRPRGYDDPAAPLDVEGEATWVCDYDAAKSRGDLAGAIQAGLRQRTCPACHTQAI